MIKNLLFLHFFLQIITKILMHYKKILEKKEMIEIINLKQRRRKVTENYLFLNF